MFWVADAQPESKVEKIVENEKDQCDHRPSFLLDFSCQIFLPIRILSAVYDYLQASSSTFLKDIFPSTCFSSLSPTSFHHYKHQSPPSVIRRHTSTMFAITTYLAILVAALTLTDALPNPIASPLNHGLFAGIEERNIANPSVYVCQNLLVTPTISPALHFSTFLLHSTNKLLAIGRNPAS
jgi:hypothetical protein